MCFKITVNVNETMVCYLTAYEQSIIQSTQPELNNTLKKDFHLFYQRKKKLLSIRANSITICGWVKKGVRMYLKFIIVISTRQ